MHKLRTANNSKRVVLLTITTSILLTTNALAASDFVNGSFEASTTYTGWTAYLKSATSGTFKIISDGTAADGDRYMQIKIYTPNNWGGIQQTLTGLTPGSAYTISGSYQSNSTASTASVRYSLTGDTVRTQDTPILAQTRGPSGWKTFSATITATQSSLTVFFDHQNSSIVDKMSSFDNITITECCTSASISTQPIDQTAPIDSVAVFTVAATGTNLAYQWQVSTDGGSTWNNVSSGTGDTTDAYTTAELSGSEHGYRYRCIVSASCDDSSAISQPATLHIECPGFLESGNNDTDDDGTPDCLDICPYDPTDSCADAPIVEKWESVKTHTSVGAMAIELSNLTVEPRKGDLKIRVTFSHEMETEGVDSSYVMLTDSTHAPVVVAGAVMTDPKTLEVTVAQANADAKQLKLALNSSTNKLKRAEGPRTELAETSLTFRCLTGDVTGDQGKGNGIVTIVDMAKVRDNIAKAVTSATCIYDVNLNGTITIADMAMVKLNLGKTAP